MSLDPAIVSAIIGVGGAAGVAIAGFVTTMRTTRQTIESGAQSTRDALASAEANVRTTVRGEREHRLWERRTDLYVDLLAFAIHRREDRANELKMFRWDEETEARRKQWLDSHKLPDDMFVMEARIRAFASNRVLQAFDAANAAHAMVRDAVEDKDIAPNGEQKRAAFAAIHELLMAAVSTDDALITAVREEVQLMRE